MVGQPEAWGQPLSGEPVCQWHTRNPFKQNVILIKRTTVVLKACSSEPTSRRRAISIGFAGFVHKGLKMDAAMIYAPVIAPFIDIPDNTQPRIATLTPISREGVRRE
jgi:hypothetical protein